jgi:hypothetical protein
MVPEVPMTALSGATGERSFSTSTASARAARNAAGWAGSLRKKRSVRDTHPTLNDAVRSGSPLGVRAADQASSVLPPPTSMTSRACPTGRGA